MKRLLISILTISLVFSIFSPVATVFAHEPTCNDLIVLPIWDSAENNMVSPCYDVPVNGKVTIPFIITDSNENIIAYFDADVYVDRSAVASGNGIVEVKGSFRNAQVSGLSYRVTYGYNRANIYITRNGTHIYSEPFTVAINLSGNVYVA